MSRVLRQVTLQVLCAGLAATVVWPGLALARCGSADTPLARLALDEDPPAGRVSVEATVSAAFTGKEALNGFYLAEAAEEGVPAGLFVYAPDLEPGQARRLRPGAVVRLNGRLGRYRGQRQLEGISGLAFCGQAAPPDPVPLELPAPAARLRRLDGLPVRIKQALTVTDNYNLGRYGSLELTPGPRLYAGPGDGADASRLVLDDGSMAVRPETVPFLNGRGTRRLGSRLQGLSGVLASTFGRYRVHPLGPLQWREANAREAPAAPDHGVIRVALFNVKNYFVRLGERGARTAAGRRLQRDKLVAAMVALDADVLALLEIANADAAMASLRDAVNARVPPEQQYRSALAAGPVGGDAIRPALLYRPAQLAAVDEARVHDNARFERPPISARFQAPGGEAFTVVLAHLKSKGGCPTGRRSADTAAGCWSGRRAAQARALLHILDRLPGDRELLLADLNAYAWEKPPVLLGAGGLANLAEGRLPRAQRYTYVYRGRAGMLDYAFAGEGLQAGVDAVRIWHLNADEPRFLGYQGRAEAARAAGAYRSSDHDVVIVDLANP